MRAGSLAAAAVFAAIAVGVFYGALGFPTPMTPGAPSPGRLPMVYGAALLILSGVLVWSTLRGDGEEPLVIKSGGRLLAFAALTAVYLLLLPHFGFLAVTVPWLLIAVRVGGAGWLGSSLTAIVLPGSIYSIFFLLLGVPLP